MSEKETKQKDTNKTETDRWGNEKDKTLPLPPMRPEDAPDGAG